MGQKQEITILTLSSLPNALMFQNYFKIAWRNLMKRKFYSLVTIFGLSVGMTFTFLIGSFVWGELQVNKDLRNAGSQYMLKSKWKKADMGVDIATLAPLGKALKETYPNLVANYYRFDGITSTVSKGDKHFKEEFQIGDSTLLTMYGFPLLHGDAATALNEPNSVVLPYNIAIKYFGITDVVGQTLTLDSFSGQKGEFMITAVLDKLPHNSVANLVDDRTPIFLPPGSMQFFGRGDLENWSNTYIVNFIELKPGVAQESLIKPIQQLIATNTPASVSQNLEVELVPLSDLYWEANNGLVQKTVLTISTVALFILFMAIVNFVNISIGSSSARLKEIGVRKVLGSLKIQVIRQFLTESILIALLSLILSLFLYEVLKSYFTEILGKTLPSIFLSGPYFILAAIFLALITGLLAGIYPAFILSSLPSVDSMKGKLKSVKENIFFRRMLIASQFTIALFVFVAAAVISQQVSYFFNKDLGYNKEFIFSVTVPRDWSAEGVQKMETIRKEMARLPEVTEASVSYEIPNGRNGFSAPVYKLGQDSTQAVFMPVLQADENYAETYKIPMVSGQFFQSVQQNADEVVVNEETLKAMNLGNTASAVGQKLKLQGFNQTFTIAGVVKNFHFESMHQTIRPLAFLHIKTVNNYRFLSFKVSNGNVGKSVAGIEKKWNQLLPDAPFEYTFMDDTLHKLYKSEVRLQKASQVATILAMVIVLLGILGMVSLNVSKRTKELGIRKVLGASALSIIILFVKEFLYVMGISMLISFPLVILSMNKWLQNYAYRIQLDWLTFAYVGLIFGIVIAVLVGLQTYKAAMMNPVKSIKTE